MSPALCWPSVAWPAAMNPSQGVESGKSVHGIAGHKSHQQHQHDKRRDGDRIAGCHLVGLAATTEFDRVSFSASAVRDWSAFR